MKGFLSELASEFIIMQGDRCLEFSAVPRQRTSVGVDCEPWSQSNDSHFPVAPRQITAQVLENVGLPAPFVCPPTEASVRVSHFDELLREILTGTTSIKPSAHVDKPRKHMTKCLSSNQLFLGVYHSTHRDCVLTQKSQIAQSLDRANIPDLDRSPAAIDEIFGRRIGFRD
jgi:hypothetical protein